MLNSCMESRPSSKSVGDEVGKESDLSMKRKSKNTSRKSSALNTSPDRGFDILSVTGPKLLITLSLMDSLSSPGEVLSQSSKSNTIIARRATFSLWINICRWLEHYSALITGSFRSSLLSNGMIEIQATRQALDFESLLTNAQRLRLGCIYADRTG